MYSFKPTFILLFVSIQIIQISLGGPVGLKKTSADEADEVDVRYGTGGNDHLHGTGGTPARFSGINMENETYEPKNVIMVSSTVVYISAVAVILLLLMNLSCLYYVNCYSGVKYRKQYHNVSQMASSDEDMENLKV
eukprot:129963_1